MSLKPLALVFCGLLALSDAGCKDTVRNRVARNEEDPALWLQNVLAAEVRLPETGQAAAAKLSQFLKRAASVPGVEQVSIVDVLPGATMAWRQVQIEHEGSQPHLRPAGFVQVVSPWYFETMGLRLLRGRFFSNGDLESGLPVTIVNESYAQQTASSGDVGKSHDVVGDRVKLGWGANSWLTIVGIVQDGPRAQHVQEVYVPYTQPAQYGSGASRFPPGAPPWYMLARVTRDRDAVAARLRQALGWEFRTMEERLGVYMKDHEPG